MYLKIFVLPIELDGNAVDHTYIQQISEMLGNELPCTTDCPVSFPADNNSALPLHAPLPRSPQSFSADEPTGNLDSHTSQDVLSLLKITSTKFGQTIVMITHNEEIAQLADRIIRIEDGQIRR